MSPMSRAVLKIIFAVLAIYFVLAAVPIFLRAYQGMASAPVPSLAPALPTPTSNQAVFEQDRPAAAIGQPDLSSKIFLSDVRSAPALAPTALASNRAAQPFNYSYILLNVFKSVPSSGQNSAYPYKAQAGTPVFLQNFSHAYAGCNWLSVAGQVFDSKGHVVTNLVVSVTGTLKGSKVDLLGLTGLAPAYGAGGYEIQLASSPVASTGTLMIQVFDLQGKSLTSPQFFNTSAACSENVILINFAP